MKENLTKQTFLQWIAVEPFRIFFLSGTIFSILGVALWPLFYGGAPGFNQVYPGLSHSHMMIQSFGGAFVLGFLGTAAPRMLEAHPLRAAEVAVLLILHFANGILLFLGKNVWGDAVFALLLMVFGILLISRVRVRKDNLPPSFLLAGVGILCGFVGATLFTFQSLWGISGVYKLAGLLLYEGFLLGPVMGIGIFFFPRLLGGKFHWPNAQEESNLLWRMGVIALFFLASFLLEVWGSELAGQLLRIVVVLTALTQVSWRKEKKSADTPKAVGTLGNALRFLCVPLAVIGLVAPVLIPMKRVADLHMLFMVGFGLLMWVVASRVLFGHSGSVKRFANRSWTARFIVISVLIAVLTRVSADFIPSQTISHHVYAAIWWIIAAVTWILWHSRRFFQPDEE